MLSHIGTDVLDEWAFGFQGASGLYLASHPTLLTKSGFVT